MTVLTETIEWKRRAMKPRAMSLTDEEAARVRQALLVLRARHGGWEAVGREIGASYGAVRNIASRTRPTAAVALAVARKLGVHVEDVLSGAWPKPGTCPFCGRCKEEP